MLVHIWCIPNALIFLEIQCKGELQSHVKLPFVERCCILWIPSHLGFLVHHFMSLWNYWWSLICSSLSNILLLSWKFSEALNDFRYLQVWNMFEFKFEIRSSWTYLLLNIFIFSSHESENFLTALQIVLLLIFVLCRFGHVYSNLQSRLTKTLLNAFLDPKKAMTQHYGAIQGLTALGPNVVSPFPCSWLYGNT